MAVRAPGQGAAILAPPRGQYVYVVRSRRTGEVSIGIDLTPNGACPLSCDYCQVSRTARLPPEPVSIDGATEELAATLRVVGSEAGDVVFAGSGEPTWPSEFPGVLEAARDRVARLPRRLPVRVFTSGTTLDREVVAHALHALVHSGDGEVWVKLDAWDEASQQRFWGTRGKVAHERRVATFGAHTPLVLQSMLVHRRPDATVQDAASGLAAAVARLLAHGCRIDRVMLSTLFRPPGDGGAALAPYDEAELGRVAEAIRAVGVSVFLPHYATRVAE
jgi:wyosine [tRNA(Phe)-imidazoG37] synthetase (radical SAM superfamily)